MVYSRFEFKVQSQYSKSLNMQKQAVDQFLLVVALMHATAETEFECFAVLARPRFGPRTFAEYLETVLPYVPEIVTIDIALSEIVADAGAAGNAAIDAYARHVHTRNAPVEMVAHLPLKTS